MVSQPLPPRTCASLLAALTLAVSACGGGTTGGPVGGATAASAPVPGTTAQVAPATTAAKPVPPSAATRTSATTRRPPPRTPADPPAPPADPAASPEPDPAPPRPAPDAMTRRAATRPAPAPQGTPIDERAELTLTDRDGLAHYFQQGTVTGTYEGTMAAEVRITSKGVFVDFTATVEGGTIVGRALAVAVIDGRPMPALRGTAAIHAGTGRFAGIHGRRLTVSGRSKPDGSRARVRLLGNVDGAP